MTERRWDPTLQEWVITATHRQERTFKPPADYCPFCPTEEDAEYPTAIPEPDYDMAVVENGFPSLQPDPPEPAVEGSDLLPAEPANGQCEVVLFTPEHDGTMSQEPVSRFVKLVKLWRDRYETLGQKDDHEYVYVFENRGEDVGVTLHHPHGQIYAYPFVPPKIQTELQSSQDHLEEHGRCLFCDLVDAEREDGRRIVADNDAFTAVVPYFARWAYEVHVYANDHLPSLAAFDSDHEQQLGQLLKDVQLAYDGLFDVEMPYVMAMHQQPTTGTGEDYAHFHMEFYPPKRTEDKLKHLAGSELGAGTYINNKLAEESAAELRESLDAARE
ncbi:galactose-1-phosphate uridylyltransferase [Halapricum desulfuricans]|uniref:UDP-glucose--hexose-1-phosphate uridylyltransferase n=1 Tax=Halapricum desulfuricans TaxID=2841257 RepID=A0A897NHP9_9EURY|nr:galactose-1-phosphate uridylyltransferase [Halapricum desulfuricans]QSG09947.1 Galactose-1-phosphate uridylyltransferase [Halapricum desulfuricans]QSG10965.1 Galactose-1-phosphate uridylyltransferase [Halapricum desulfuricans]